MRRNLLVAVAAMTASIAPAMLPATASSAMRASAGSDAVVTSVSCAWAGDCAAGGHYFDASGRVHAFVLTERNGRWGRAIEVPGLAALRPQYADVRSVSCAPEGDCAAGGYYQDTSSRYHAFVTSERNGRWRRFITVFSARTALSAIAGVRSLSCRARGSCTAGGGLRPFVVSEVNGRWRQAIQLRAKDNDFRVVVSCASAGNCAAGWGSFVARERNGRWGKPIRLPGLSALGRAAITSVSCAAAGRCAVGGNYGLASGASEAFVDSQRHGRWGNAIEVPGFTALNQEGFGDLASLSCVSAGNCEVGGSYAAPADFQGGAYEAFVANERNGRWGKAFEVRGIPPPSTGICEPDSAACVSGRVFSLACASGGPCAAGGWYDTKAINGQAAFVTIYKNGRWSKVIEIPSLESLDTAKSSEVNSVSCTPAGSCAAGGSYSITQPGVGPAFVVGEENGIWGQAQTVRF